METASTICYLCAVFAILACNIRNNIYRLAPIPDTILNALGIVLMMAAYTLLAISK